MYSKSLIYGAQVGVVSIIGSVMIYFIDRTQLYDGSFPLVIFLFCLILTWYFAKTYRDHHAGGFLSFGKSFLLSGSIIGFSSLLAAIFHFILFYHIDPELGKMEQETAQEMSIRVYEMMGMSDSQIDKQLEEAESLQTGSLLFQLVGSLFSAALTGAFWGLILGLIIKKNEPFDPMQSASGG